MSDIKLERLDPVGHGISVVDHGGRVVVEFWLESRLPGTDQLRIALTPGESLELVERVAKATKSALKASLK